MWSLVAAIVVSASGELDGLFTPSQLELVRNSTRVEAQRLSGQFDSDPHSKLAGLDRFAGRAAPVQLNRELTARAKAVATSPTSYRGGGSRCVFEPSVRLRFWAGTDAGSSFVDVLLCLHCSQVRVSKPEVEWPQQVMGFAAVQDYTNEAGMNPPPWLALVQRIFPAAHRETKDSP